MRKVTQKDLIIVSLIFGISIVLGSLQVIYSSLVSVRLLSVISIISLSFAVGFLIRELFILKEK
ncbi:MULTISPECIES: hypothetical protein [Paenibacillus]|uniref:hypothetical protein n=1 Tax=Paenibacillus TaxID=44249 RepID=UPI00300BAA3F